MKVGVFMMPNHPPDRDFSEGHEHDLDYLQFLDGLGYEEAWIGCHFTIPREPCPAPDLLVAQALSHTKNIHVSPGGYMLPYHHPAELAHRIAWLDHISQGRSYIGIGSGGVSTDWSMFNIDGMGGENREMTEESLEIMMRFWQSDGEFEYEGKYWSVRRPADDIEGNFTYHISPFTKPHPQIAIAGLSPSSPTLELAGRKGFFPLSLCLGNAYLASHWEAINKGADEAGRTPDRGNWRVGRDIYIADTDQEARDKVVNGMLGDHYREYWLPLMAGYGATAALKHDPDVPDSEVDVDYVIEHCMCVGSAETVERKIAEIVETSGGFGTLLAISYDHLDDMSGWRESKEALIKDILPKFN
jgi:alkanesulfonate monooxygenase SsuD/methylene tetrahydromethanopterin reductase-like flavin-dependent oxidoreductase (luciferase family)